MTPLQRAMQALCRVYPLLVMATSIFAGLVLLDFYVRPWLGRSQQNSLAWQYAAEFALISNAACAGIGILLFSACFAYKTEPTDRMAHSMLFSICSTLVLVFAMPAIQT